ncbi:NAD dependent epimerase/dehydratase family protein-like protein [Mytilinidion resinicola]|uniref:NAD dependent epimerase/dehydratase family protein-like protein n=1 Tax=Mytilinidion resinicola TaxID=574789 RepID=A0A6A6YX32_9PEZI|nr:NAD dependent epimerase/dehydratase family protein-like protein [Mytilinidion resinicola]KAF2812564.1 NAD dependent epimerase/dehydratase family protein-like protein [Mytilinidion resinicola]
MTIHQVQSRSIYHGLPVYPKELKGLTAIITGANGISGYHMLRVLAQDPDRWTKIYCLSRRPPAIPGGLPSNAEHIALDLLKKPGEIAEVLKSKGVTADYVFFFAYIQVAPKPGERLWSDAEEMCRVNTALLSNFCDSLPLASINPKRILLQTGAKNYGAHVLPQTPKPLRESLPRVLLAPNFYYTQEDFLAAFCATQQHTSYTITMPSYIPGAVPDAAMNVVLPLGIYAAVGAHLAEPLVYPGTAAGWRATQCQSSAMLNAYMAEWAVFVRDEDAAGEKFNCCDGSAFTWGGLWEALAGWYGMEVLGPGDGEEWERRKMGLTAWAKTERVRRAWGEVAERWGLVHGELWDVERLFAFTEGALGGVETDYSMDKSRKLGWFGTVDTTESIRKVLDEFAELKMIPPVPKR